MTAELASSPSVLERLQNDPEMPFIERGLPTDLMPDRDVGAMVHGEIADGTVAYALGIFDGAEDGKSIDNDPSDKKDVAARIFLRPRHSLSHKVTCTRRWNLSI
jgi:phosphate-selective porin OprO/OprP